jgi:hypothetical protein
VWAFVVVVVGAGDPSAHSCCRTGETIRVLILCLVVAGDPSVRSIVLAPVNTNRVLYNCCCSPTGDTSVWSIELLLLPENPPRILGSFAVATPLVLSRDSSICFFTYR